MYVENIDNYTKNLNNINEMIKSNIKAAEFVKEFKDKIKYHLDSKPIQDLKSFLKNFENLMTQHKKKMMKAYPIDLIEQNYELILVWILFSLHEDSTYECEILNGIKYLKPESFEQIQNSFVVKSNSSQSEEAKEHLVNIDQNTYLECLKMVLQKVINKLAKPKKPQTYKALLKDIENQIDN